MKFATLRHLETFAKEFLAIEANQKVSLCKYVPHKFEWEHFDPNRDVSSGKGKKKNLQKAHQIDLKNFPFLLVIILLWVIIETIVVIVVFGVLCQKQT